MADPIDDEAITFFEVKNNIDLPTDFKILLKAYIAKYSLIKLSNEFNRMGFNFKVVQIEK